MNKQRKTEAKRQLEEVNQAISNIMLGGQSNSISGAGGSSAVTHANLRDLQLERTRLESIVYGSAIRSRSGTGARP